MWSEFFSRLFYIYWSLYKLIVKIYNRKTKEYNEEKGQELRQKCFDGDYKSVRDLLNQNVNPNYTDKKAEDWESKSQSPLLVTCLNNSNTHTEIAKLLIMNKADINFKNAYGQTPLGESVRCKNYDLIEFLENNGAKK